MMESGFDKVDNNLRQMMPLVIRAIDPKIFYRILASDDNDDLSLEECKDAFFLLFAGCFLGYLCSVKARLKMYWRFMRKLFVFISKKLLTLKNYLYLFVSNLLISINEN